MITQEVLQAARELIADPAHWTQFVAARDARGYRIGPDDPQAVRWCPIGAVYVVAARLGVVDETRDVLPREVRETLAWINDMQGHAAVLAEMDRLIAVVAAK